MSLVDSLISTGYLKTPRIIEAFKDVDRADFLPEELKDAAGMNQAMPIGFDQTISQPLVVAFMLEELSPEPGQKVLDIGFGSGWTTALLAKIIGSGGLVVAVEIIEGLYKMGEENLEKYHFSNVKLRLGDWHQQIGEDEKFDRIQAACSPLVVPPQLKLALNTKGRLVLPVEHDKWGDQSVKTIVRLGDDRFEEQDHPGFRFVSMVDK
ncbi:MAG: L-isoaspartyl protein carboxyl methyltransferase [Berkelbacteria bacterium GW2011_GWA2_38_9]|uniref:Protein-L-isoaspartate O-methyltransferase n=1 Tax=Berkelbacteria bacterium GW2011_GWA2_38_9 TaxID=1618334 RepID=A0A0G0LNT0_9BACT|nr:MAG: L-isoaspartyl protein carboxyl methyltransferase [Berkelbacteria bacterium GW2011_GWA2_38_9]